MNENIKKLFEKISADEELQAKLSEITDPDEAFALVSSIQDGFTREEFEAAVVKMEEALANNDDLTDEDLAAIAGGVGVTTTVTAGAAFVGSAAASWIITAASFGGI